MSTALRTRVFTIAAGIFLVIAIIAYVTTMVTGSTRAVAAGNLGATLAVVLFLGRVTARYARLLAVADTVVAPEDPVVSPRQSPEDALGDEERARRG